MDEQIEEIIKKQARQGVQIPIADLRHRGPSKRKIDEETISRLQKLKKYALHDTSIPTEKLNHYYCSLCGRINLVTNVLMETLPQRKTDKAISIDLKVNFIKLNLQRDKIKYIRRDQGIETHYRWKCECGIPIGYTAINYEELQETRLNQAFVCSNRPYFYVYKDALVEKMKQSKLLSEIITYKETILLHLKRKNRK